MCLAYQLITVIIENREKNRIEHFPPHSVIDLQGFPTTAGCCRRVVKLCSLYNSNPAKIAVVWCLELCAATLFAQLLKFGAVRSIICGFLMAVCCWRHRLQCVVIMQSFLRLLKLCKLAVCKLYLTRRGRLTWCHGVLDHGLNLQRNIPLRTALNRAHGIMCLLMVTSFILDLMCRNGQWYCVKLDMMDNGS